MYFPNYRLQKRSLDKYLQNPVLEVNSTTNIAKGPKDCRNMHKATFTIFVDPRAQNPVSKSVRSCSAKSKVCLLTH